MFRDNRLTCVAFCLSSVCLRSFSNWTDVVVEAGGPEEYHLTYMQSGRRAGVSMRIKDMVNYGMTML